MLEVLSLYTGEPVKAANSDYDSYKELGLVCPFCREPVFLKKEFVRRKSKNEGSTIIPAHFCHFITSGKEVNGEDCEARSRTAEGKRYIEKIREEIALAKAQRLDVFHKYFWDIFSKRFRLPKNPEKLLFSKTIPCSEEVTRICISNMLDLFKNREKQSLFTQTRASLVKALEMYREAVEDDVQLRTFEHLKDLHKQQLLLGIYEEIIEFLSAPSSVPVMRKIMATIIYMRTGLIHASKEKDPNGSLADVLPLSLDDLINKSENARLLIDIDLPITIISVDWLGAVEKYKDKAKFKGFRSK